MSDFNEDVEPDEDEVPTDLLILHVDLEEVNVNPEDFAKEFSDAPSNS